MTIEAAGPFREAAGSVRFFPAILVCGRERAGFLQRQTCEPGSHPAALSSPYVARDALAFGKFVGMSGLPRAATNRETKFQVALSGFSAKGAKSERKQMTALTEYAENRRKFGSKFKIPGLTFVALFAAVL